MDSAAESTADGIAERIVEMLDRALPGERPIALHEPAFQGGEWDRVRDCLDSGWVSSVGGHVDGFEQALAAYTGIPHALATVNGTAALHSCLVLAGVQPGDEVLLPALTFVGTANPVAHLGATPHFVDTDRATLGVDPLALDDYLSDIARLRGNTCYNRHSDRPLRALVAVHVLGHIGDMDALLAVLERYRIGLIEDAAEALGSWREGRHAGGWARLAALSFNGNKIITTGGGGAILTRDPDLARQARHLTTTAKRPHPWAFEHDQVGYNHRMPNLNAALGEAQLEGIETLLRAKRALAERYQALFDGQAGVELFREPAGCRSNHWLNLLLLDDPAQRDPLLRRAHEQGLQLRPFWTPLNRLPMYRDCPAMPLPATSTLFERGVCLPSSATLELQQDLAHEKYPDHCPSS